VDAFNRVMGAFMQASTAASILLILTASSQSSPGRQAQSPAILATASVVDLYVCNESADIDVLDVHLEVKLQNQAGASIYIPRELTVLRSSIASDLDAALNGRWEVPALVADAFSDGMVRVLGRSDLAKIPSGGDLRQQLTASVRLKRVESADDPTAVPPGVHHIVLELRTLPTWAKEPTYKTGPQPVSGVWVRPIVVAPLRVDSMQAVSLGSCADTQLEWVPWPDRQ
jgi:hypothetical protein